LRGSHPSERPVRGPTGSDHLQRDRGRRHFCVASTRPITTHHWPNPLPAYLVRIGQLATPRGGESARGRLIPFRTCPTPCRLPAAPRTPVGIVGSDRWHESVAPTGVSRACHRLGDGCCWQRCSRFSA